MFFYERDFMHTFKNPNGDLIDKLIDPYRYVDDIFTINYPEFAKHIPDISNRTSVV